MLTGLISAKAKGLVPGVMRSAKQYGVEAQFLDCLTFDVTRNPLRRGGWIDAIITDPPCKLSTAKYIFADHLDGVRAGAKRLGKKETNKKPMLEEPFLLPDGTFAHTCTTPYRPHW